MSGPSVVADGLSCTYIPLTEGLLVAAYMKNAASEVVLINVDEESYSKLPLEVVRIDLEAMRRISDNEFVLVGSTLDKADAVYRVSTRKGTKELIKSSTSVEISDDFISKAEVISFPRTYGNVKGLAHAIYVPPHNTNFQAPSGTKPPLVVWMHGGPTTQVTPGLLMQTQYWTSRGYAYVSVNYGGSTGILFDLYTVSSLANVSQALVETTGTCCMANGATST